MLLKKGFSFFLLLLLFVPSVHSNEDKTKLMSVMQGNFQALVDLQTYVADPEKFNDPSNEDKILSRINTLTEIKHVFSKDKTKDLEPGLASIASLFEEYLEDVKASFKDGKKDFARNKIRTMTAFCLSCHSRTSSDQMFAQINNKVDTKSLTQFQRAEFYAATRQFDKAIAELQSFFENRKYDEIGFLEFTKSIRTAINLSVRVKQDPELTLKLLAQLMKRKELPEFFQHELEGWKKDAEYWKSQGNPKKGTSPDMLMNLARKLFERAEKLKLFPADHSGDISYLRASNYIHQALTQNTNAPFRGEALYLLGSAYESLQDPLLWALDGLYFESCVREFPHTAQAKKCFRRYSAKIYFGYSGSGGTFVPKDEMQKIKELEALSQ